MRRPRALSLLALPAAAGPRTAPPAGPAAAPAASTSADATPVLAGITAPEPDALRAPEAEPGDPMLAMRGGTVPEGAFVRASAQAAQLGEKTKGVDKRLAEVPWQLQGPTNIGGRVLDILHAPT